MDIIIRIAIVLVGIIIYNRFYMYVQNAKYDKRMKLTLMAIGNVILVALGIAVLFVGR